MFINFQLLEKYIKKKLNKNKLKKVKKNYYSIKIILQIMKIKDL